MDILPQRIERLQSVISRRQYDLTVVLENVHDPHNIGAVLRTCDCVGISEVYIIYTEPDLIERGIEVGYHSSSGARKWVEVKYFTDLEEAMKTVKDKYQNIFGTVITESSSSLYDLPLDAPTALLFGNEHAGISEEAGAYIDQNFLIPQHGFVQSLNISVACAVSLYEAQRQRLEKNKYNRSFGDHTNDNILFEHYKEKHFEKKLNKTTKRTTF